MMDGKEKNRNICHFYVLPRFLQIQNTAPPSICNSSHMSVGRELSLSYMSTKLTPKKSHNSA